mmetsp:Transcript_28692/g.58706  ORF Transcript_28692/g.58706 Transcript_28692/m.58706 type:complete len:327 (-) Transcript_28692:1249-2229(-)
MRNAVVGARRGNQMPLRDFHLVLRSVAGDGDDLHAVFERAWHRVEGVGCADEEYLGQVDWYVEVVVEELVVLRRVQHLQQCRGGVPLVASTKLVDFVQHDHRVVAAHVLQCLNKLARHSANVGAAMALDLRHVRHPPHRKPEELAVEGGGNALADGRLAHPGGAVEADDLPLDGALEGADSDELEDAILHVCHPVVVLVQRDACSVDVEVLLSGGAPGKPHQPVQIRPCDVELGGGGLEERQLLQLLLNHLFRGGRDGHAGKLLGHLLDQIFLLVHLHPQLLLDDLQLLCKEVLTLHFADVLLHLLVDALLHLRLFEFDLQKAECL